MGSIPNNPDGFIPLPALASVPRVAGGGEGEAGGEPHAAIVLAVLTCILAISASLYTYQRLYRRSSSVRSRPRRIYADPYRDCSSNRYLYIVQFVTGLRPGAGTYGSIVFSVQGDRQSTPTYFIEPLTITGRTVERASILTFVIHTPESIGDVQFGEVELVDEHAECWYLKYMTVIDPLLTRQWYMPCHKWLRAGPQSTGRQVVSTYNLSRLWGVWDRMTEVFHCTSISPDRLDLRTTLQQANILAFIDKIFYLCVPAVAMFCSATALLVCAHCATLTDKATLLAHVWPRCLVYNLMGDVIILVSMLARKRLTPLSTTPFRYKGSKQQLMLTSEEKCPFANNAQSPSMCRSPRSPLLPAAHTATYTPSSEAETPKKITTTKTSPCFMPCISAGNQAAYGQRVETAYPLNRSRSPAKRVSAKGAFRELATQHVKEPRRAFDQSASPANRVSCREGTLQLRSAQSADRSSHSSATTRQASNNAPPSLFNGQHLCKKHRICTNNADDEEAVRVGTGSKTTSTSQPTNVSTRGRSVTRQLRSNFVSRSASSHNYTANANTLTGIDLSELNSLNNNALYIVQQRPSSPAGASDKSQMSNLSRDTALVNAITSNLKAAIRETSTSRTRAKLRLFSEHENLCLVLNKHDRKDKIISKIPQNMSHAKTDGSIPRRCANDQCDRGEDGHIKSSRRRVSAPFSSTHAANGHGRNTYSQSSPSKLRDFTSPDGRQTVVQSLQHHLDNTNAGTNTHLSTHGERKTGKKSKHACHRQTARELTSYIQHCADDKLPKQDLASKPQCTHHTSAIDAMQYADRVTRFQTATLACVSDAIEVLSAGNHKTSRNQPPIQQLDKAGDFGVESLNQPPPTHLSSTEQQPLHSDQLDTKASLQLELHQTNKDSLQKTSHQESRNHSDHPSLLTNETSDGMLVVSKVARTSTTKKGHATFTKDLSNVKISHVAPALPDTSADIPEKLPKSLAIKPLPVSPISANISAETPHDAFTHTGLYRAHSKTRRRTRRQRADDVNNGANNQAASTLFPIIMTSQYKQSADAVAVDNGWSDESNTCMTRILKALDWPLGGARAVESYHSLSSVTPSIVSDIRHDNTMTCQTTQVAEAIAKPVTDNKVSTDCFIAERLIAEAEAALEYTSESDISESTCKNNNANTAYPHTQLLAAPCSTSTKSHSGGKRGVNGDVSLLHVQESLRDDIKEIAKALHDESATSEHTSALTLAVTEIILNKMKKTGRVCMVCLQPGNKCVCEKQLTSRVYQHTHTRRLVLAILRHANSLLMNTSTADTLRHDTTSLVPVTLIPCKRSASSVQGSVLSITQSDICDNIYSLIVNKACDSAVQQVTNMHQMATDKLDQCSSALQSALASFLGVLRHTVSYN